MNALLLAAVLSAATPTEAEKAAADKNQDVASGLQAEGVEKAKYNDIERGFGVRLNVGMLAYVTPAGPTIVDGTVKRQTPGMLLGIELGYDILPIFDIGAFFYFGQTTGAESTCSGSTVDQCTGRDLSTMFGGVMARVSFFHTERVYLGVKAGAGYGLQDNRIEAATQGVAVPVAVTLEYFTRIRHFSLAIDVGALVWIPTSGGSRVAIGITATPAIKYTF